MEFSGSFGHFVNSQKEVVISCSVLETKVTIRRQVSDEMKITKRKLCDILLEVLVLPNEKFSDLTV